jgi:uncharacterized membrane protein (UPF0127 family)
VRSRVLSITAAVLVTAFIAACGGGKSNAGGLRVDVTGKAEAPFSDFGETRLVLGANCLRLLVARTQDQRVQGLRDVRALAPYAGMIFVYDDDVTTRFTMANTPTPLDIAFFDKDGELVDELQMTPCPDGTDATCPVYASKAKYRYAVERPAPTSAAGALASCA